MRGAVAPKVQVDNRGPPDSADAPEGTRLDSTRALDVLSREVEFCP
jgi:hypothetical protein